MDLHEMESALDEAEIIQRRANLCANRAARLIIGRLKHVSSWTLAELKKELKDYNAHTGVWK